MTPFSTQITSSIEFHHAPGDRLQVVDSGDAGGAQGVLEFRPSQVGMRGHHQLS